MVRRVALFIPNLEMGGAERVFIHLARGFVELGARVDLVVANASGPLRQFVPPCVGIVDLNVNRTLAALQPLRVYLKDVQPDILLSALDHSNIVSTLSVALSRIRCKIVLTQHNTISPRAKSSRSVKGRLMPFLIGRFYRAADAIVAVSHGVRKDLLRHGVPPGKVHVIYNPVLTPEMDTLMQEPVGHPWFDRERAVPVVVGAGRFKKEKDFPTLITAFALSCRERPMRLVILGDGEERPKLERLIDKLGIGEHVWMPGFVDNPYKYFAAADLFVLSSQTEGFANVLVEALAAGIRIVATDCPSGPSEILQGGVYGRLVPPRNPEALSAAILDALSEEADPLVLKRRASEFTYTNAATKYFKLFERLLNSER